MNRLALPAALAVLSGLVLGGAACSLKPQRQEARPPEPAYAFPHQPHVEGDVACTACHAGIADAKELAAGVRHVQLPKSPSKDKRCNECHDTDVSLQVPSRTAPFRVRFDHQQHLAKVKDCRSCHQKLTEQGDTRAAVPPMAACTSCHNHQSDFAAAKCMPCHVDLKGYEPQTAFSHAGDWMKVHGSMARPTAESCAACHDQTYCAECHAAQTTAARPSVIFPESVDRGFIHRGDYVSRHAVDAQANPASCRSCHGSPFCSSCHSLQGVTSSAVNVRDPHPVGWATDRGTDHFHGYAARRDILSCAGCHDNGASSTCVSCHQMGGVGGNPHPSSFISKHSGEDRTRKAMCSACHTF
jgi:hypothetical protein